MGKSYTFEMENILVIAQVTKMHLIAISICASAIAGLLLCSCRPADNLPKHTNGAGAADNHSYTNEISIREASVIHSAMCAYFAPSRADFSNSSDIRIELSGFPSASPSKVPINTGGSVIWGVSTTSATTSGGLSYDGRAHIAYVELFIPGKGNPHCGSHVKLYKWGPREIGVVVDGQSDASMLLKDFDIIFNNISELSGEH